jgi:hypothetical protein
MSTPAGSFVDGLECMIEGDLDVQGFLGLDENVRSGYQGIRVAFKATGDFDDDQLAELVSLTRYSPVRDSLLAVNADERGRSEPMASAHGSRPMRRRSVSGQRASPA